MGRRVDPARVTLVLRRGIWYVRYRDPRYVGADGRAQRTERPLETTDRAEAERAARDFLTRRTVGEKAVPLSRITGDKGHANIPVKRDQFKYAYCGRMYESDGTEIVSMGLEMLYRAPRDFAQSDPEYFNLMVRLLSGGAPQ